MIATAAAEPKSDNVERLALSLLPLNKSGKQQVSIGGYDFRFRGHNDRGYGIKVYVDSADNAQMLAQDRKWHMFDVSKEDGKDSYALCATKTSEAPLLRIDASTDSGDIVRHVAAACIKYVQRHKTAEAAAEPGTDDVFTALLDKLHDQAPAKAYLGGVSIHATGIHAGPFKSTIFIDVRSGSGAPRSYELTLRHRYGNVYLIQVVSEFDAKKQIKVKASDPSELVANIAKAISSTDIVEAAAEPGHTGHLRGDFPGLALISVPERNGKQFETELRRACNGTVNIDASHAEAASSILTLYSRQRSDVEFKNYVKTLLALVAKFDATLIVGRGDRYKIDADKPNENTDKLREITKILIDEGHEALQRYPHDFPKLAYGPVEAAAEPNPGDDVVRIFKALEQKLPRTDPDKPLKEFKPLRVQGLNFVVLSHENDNTIRFHILDNIYHACGFAEIPFSFNNDLKSRCVRLELQGRSGMERHDIKHAIDTSDLLRQMLVWFATTYKARHAALTRASAEPTADAYADLLRRLGHSKNNQLVMRDGEHVVECGLTSGRPGIFMTVSSKAWPADWYAPFEILEDERGRVHVWKQIRAKRVRVSGDLLAGKPDLKTFTQLLFKEAVAAGTTARKVYEEEREDLARLRTRGVKAAAEPASDTGVLEAVDKGMPGHDDGLSFNIRMNGHQVHVGMRHKEGNEHASLGVTVEISGVSYMFDMFATPVESKMCLVEFDTVGSHVMCAVDAPGKKIEFKTVKSPVQRSASVFNKLQDVTKAAVALAYKAALMLAPRAHGVQAAAEPQSSDFSIEMVYHAFAHKADTVTKLLTFTSGRRTIYLSMRENDNNARNFWEISFDVFGELDGSDDFVDLDYVAVHLFKDRSGFEVERRGGKLGNFAKAQRFPWSVHLNGDPNKAVLFLVSAIRSWVRASEYIKAVDTMWPDEATASAEPAPAPSLAALSKQAMEWLRGHESLIVSGSSVRLRVRPGMNPNRHTVDFWMTRSADPDAVVNSRALDCSVSWKTRGRDKLEVNLWRKFYAETPGTFATQAESKHVIHMSGFTVDKFMKSVLSMLLKTDEGVRLMTGEVGNPTTAAVEPKDARPETLANQLVALRAVRKTVHPVPHVFLNKVPSVRRNVFAASVTSKQEIGLATFEAAISLEPDSDTPATRYLFNLELWFLLKRKKSLVLTSVRCEPFMRRVVKEATIGLDVTGKSVEDVMHLMSREVARYIRDNLADIVAFIAQEKSENDWDNNAAAWSEFAQKLKAGKS